MQPGTRVSGQLMPEAFGCGVACQQPSRTGYLHPLSRACLPCPPPACSKTGEVLGWYFDPSSSPDQKLDLAARRAGPAGWAFPHYELA